MRKPEDEKKRSHAAAFSKDTPKKKPLLTSATSAPASSPLKTIARAPETSKTTAPKARPIEATPRPKAVPQVLHPPVERKAAPQDTKLPVRRRKRLIDALSAQKADSSDESEQNDSDDDGVRTIRRGSETPLSQVSGSQAELELRVAPTSNLLRTPVSKKVKYTYSQTRSIRSDTQKSADDPFGLGPDPLAESLLPSPPIKPSGGAFDLPEDEFDLDDDEPKLAIKSAHELRRAGANSRFTDEMEDLLSRIGVPSVPPSSMRRNALLELAQKLRREDFAVQFRDNSARDSVAKGIGNEEDVICGLALGASLITFLSSKTAPNLVQHLADERIGRLLGRMLRSAEDMDTIAAQRNTNLSKMSRKTVTDVKSSLSRMAIWYDRQPTKISPRLIALQLITILHPYLETRYREQLLIDVEIELDEIVDEQVREGSEDQVEFALSACILECESGIATPTGQAWILKHASHSATLLRKILAKPSKRRDAVETAILKVAINTTNTKTGAEAFGRKALLSGLTRCICDGLGQVQGAVEQGAFQSAIYEELLLVLGVTINVLEHWPPARASLDDGDLKKLATIFFDSHQTINDVSTPPVFFSTLLTPNVQADSEDKSKVSVALGYLAVTLGYLSLDKQARNLISQRTSGAGLRELIDSIRQFIGIYRNVDSNVQELEGLVSELQRHGK